MTFDGLAIGFMPALYGHTGDALAWFAAALLFAFASLVIAGQLMLGRVVPADRHRRSLIRANSGSGPRHRRRVRTPKTGRSVRARRTVQRGAAAPFNGARGPFMGASTRAARAHRRVRGPRGSGARTGATGLRRAGRQRRLRRRGRATGRGRPGARPVPGHPADRARTGVVRRGDAGPHHDLPPADPGDLPHPRARSSRRSWSRWSTRSPTTSGSTTSACTNSAGAEARALLAPCGRRSDPCRRMATRCPTSAKPLAAGRRRTG